MTAASPRELRQRRGHDSLGGCVMPVCSSNGPSRCTCFLIWEVNCPFFVQNEFTKRCDFMHAFYTEQ